MIYKKPDTNTTIFAENSIPGKVYRIYGKDLLRLDDDKNLVKLEGGIPFLVLSNGETGHITILSKESLLIPLGTAEISVVGKQ